jgi:hypothetical protein
MLAVVPIDPTMTLATAIWLLSVGIFPDMTIL